ncbi:MAG: hypothetical protein R3254_00460 [Thiomicrorhabdus sp.]|nr:hypothetical protein [Thiomicrorhabdus sp.]
MKQNVKKATMAIGLMVATTMSATAVAQTEAGKRVLEREGSLSKTGTLELCVNYSTLTTDAERQEYIKELDLRSQLSQKDHDLMGQKKVVNSMTMCGMYMNLGKPLAEKSRQLRPMTFKTVHVYPDMYYVSQSGMIVETYPRTEGSMPPALVVEKPKVAPSPTLKP